MQLVLYTGTLLANTDAKFILEQARKVERGIRGVALLFL
jgi:hypothetical protein